jgi:hypothetical protein
MAGGLKACLGRKLDLNYFSPAAATGPYNSLGNCILTLLQVQSDHERQLANISSGVTRADIDDDYHGPVMI